MTSDDVRIMENVMEHVIDEMTTEMPPMRWHEEESCNANYSGSSPAMEAEATSRLFARSVERLGIRYKRVICDGDSKSIVRVNNEQPYGSDVVFEVIYKITFVISYLFLFLLCF